MHHLVFSITFGKTFRNQWRFLKYVEMQQHPSTGKRKVTRMSFGCFRLEYSTYILNF